MHALQSMNRDDFYGAFDLQQLQSFGTFTKNLVTCCTVRKKIEVMIFIDRFVCFKIEIKLLPFAVGSELKRNLTSRF
jgi:hypothetical protein